MRLLVCKATKKPVLSLKKAIEACIASGRRLLYDAQLLGVDLDDEQSAPTSYALCILAQEEYAKAFVLYLVENRCVPWNAEIRKMLSSHSCKHLVTLILDFLNPPDDVFDRMVEDIIKGVRADRKPYLPRDIVDAINIIRHEKAVKYASRNDWIDPDERPCDPFARKIGDGYLDKQKQDALYVRIGKTGRVISTPLKIDARRAKEEYEKARRLEGGIRIQDGAVVGPIGSDFEKIAETFKVLFGLISFEDFSKNWWL